MAFCFYICWQLAIVIFGGLLVIFILRFIARNCRNSTMHKSKSSKTAMYELSLDTYTNEFSTFNENAIQVHKINEKMYYQQYCNLVIFGAGKTLVALGVISIQCVLVWYCKYAYHHSQDPDFNPNRSDFKTVSLEIDQIIGFFFYFVIFTYHGSRVNDDGFKENNRQLEEAT